MIPWVGPAGFFLERFGTKLNLAVSPRLSGSASISGGKAQALPNGVAHVHLLRCAVTLLSLKCNNKSVIIKV